MEPSLPYAMTRRLVRTPSIAGSSAARLSRRRASRPSICPPRCATTAARSIATAPGTTTAAYGYVWYPRVAVDWRPYYDGRWSFVGVVRLDLGRRRPLDLADASLRPLGLSRHRLVLDSRPHWAPAWVSWAIRAGLRELVPARLRQPPASTRSRTSRVQRGIAVDGTSSPDHAFRSWRSRSRGMRSPTDRCRSRRVTRFVARSSAPVRPAVARLQRRAA